MGEPTDTLWFLEDVPCLSDANSVSVKIEGSDQEVAVCSDNPFWQRVETKSRYNKTGLPPVSRPVELVRYSEGWGVGAKSLAAKTLQRDKHTGLAVVPDAQKWAHICTKPDRQTGRQRGIQT